MQSSILVNSDPKKKIPHYASFYYIFLDFPHYARLIRILKKAALCKIRTIQICTKQGTTVYVEF